MIENKEIDDADAEDSLLYLAKALVRQNYEKPIILLDEYDTPLQEAWLHGYWDELVAFLRGFFNSTFKTNPYLGRGLIAGITRVAKESIFSDMNNLKVVSITSNLYTDCCGFTEQEVFSSLDEYGLTAKEEVKQWYDGFIIGSTKGIYNPCSIIGYLSEKEFAPYWVDTSSNALVGDLIAQADREVKEEMNVLLSGDSFVTHLDEQLVFSQLYTDQGAIWSLLMAAGYVKPLTRNPATGEYRLALTNHEVHFLMEKLISRWFYASSTGNEFRHALLTGDLDVMNETMSEISENTFSYFDTSGKKPERFYHAFVLGLIVDLKGRYEIKSNRESGYGRYDVSMIPLQAGDHGIVIEFKTFRPKKEKNLEEACNNALRQIRQQKYTNELKSRKVAPNKISVYGFAFAGKKVLICGGAEEEIDWQEIMDKK